MKLARKVILKYHHSACRATSYLSLAVPTKSPTPYLAALQRQRPYDHASDV